MVTLFGGMKKCGDSYEAEWISHGSAGLLGIPRMDNQFLLSSLAAMFFVTNASLNLTEEKSKYTGVHCITSNFCCGEMKCITRMSLISKATISCNTHLLCPNAILCHFTCNQWYQIVVVMNDSMI